MNKITYCRSCLLPTETKMFSLFGYNIVTCRNTACKLHYMTFTSDCYHAVNLADYGTVQHPDYERFIGLDVSVLMDTDAENVEVLHVQG